ncbi:transposase [Bradyrhizobium sp. BRP14]|nr:transposase [Bradyrhizobium sp. BRP14]
MIGAVAERLEGAPRQVRRRWSDAFKAQVVAEALEPGASVSAIIGSAFTRRSSSPGVLTLGTADLLHRGIRTAKHRCAADAVIEVVIGDIVVRAAPTSAALAAGDPGGAFCMISSGVKVFLASRRVDFRTGPARCR